MEEITLRTEYQRIEAVPNPCPGIIEQNFSPRTLYLPGDHFRYDGKHYIVKKCYQAEVVDGQEVLR